MDSVYQLSVEAIVNLAPYETDIDSDDGSVSLIVPVRRVLINVLTRQDDTLIHHHVLQNGELTGRKIDDLTGTAYSMTAHIQLKISYCEHIRSASFAAAEQERVRAMRAEVASGKAPEVRAEIELLRRELRVHHPEEKAGGQEGGRGRDAGQYRPLPPGGPHHGDLHTDHAATAASALVALRPMHAPNLRALYAYETLSESEWNVPDGAHAHTLVVNYGGLEPAALPEAMALLAGVSYAGVFLLNDLPDSDAISSVFWGDVLSALTGLPFLFRETEFTATALVSLVILGAFQVGVAYVLLCIGLKTTPPVTASLISGIEPVLNPVLVAVFYKESVGRFALVGAGIVIASVLVYNVLKSRKSTINSVETV